MSGNSKLFILFILAITLGQISACRLLQPTPRVTYLPQGDVDAGKATFVVLQCHQCHSVAGTQLDPADPGKASVHLELGGKIHRISSFSELVSAIVSPNHIISGKYLQQLEDATKAKGLESPMPNFNDDMTVRQLIDLATFLNTRYEELEPHYRGYDYGYRIF